MRPKHWLYTIPLRLRSLFRWAEADRELDDELRDHLERATEEYVAKGMALEEAQRQARLDLGGTEQTKEKCRDARRVNWIQDLAHDLHFGARMLRKSPGFTATALLALALGIGGNTGIFTLVDAIMLRTLPVKDPQQLVFVRLADPNGGYDGIPYRTFEYFRDHNNVLSGIFASSIPEHLNLSFNGQAALVSGQVVSGDYYSTLGVKAFVGRTISPSDAAPGAAPVAMISYDYWKERFAASPTVVGKSAQINGAAFTIVGVTPPGFFGLMAGFSPEVTASISMQPLLMGDGTLPNDRSTWGVEMVGGRLKASATLGQASADLDLLFKQTIGPAQQRTVARVEVSPGSRGLSVIRKHLAPPLMILVVIVGLVLLIACTNVANLMLARGIVRRKEIAMRLALGASRARLIRQMLTESVLLAMLGGTLGLAFAAWVTHLLLDFISRAGLPISILASMDWRVLAFAEVVSLATGVLFGLAPAIRVTNVSLAPDIGAGAGAASGAPLTMGPARALVVSQIAASLLLLVGVGLFLRTLQDLHDLNPGFKAKHVLLFTLEPHYVGYKGDQLASLYKNLLESIQGLPSVSAASASRFAPLSPGGARATMSAPGSASLRGENLIVQENFVGPGYFQAMGVPLFLGRDLTLQDVERTPRVAVINEAAALRYFGKRSPIGMEFSLSGRNGLIQVIGVVKDARLDSLSEPAAPGVFLPLLQFSPDAQRVTFEVRTTLTPESMATVVRQTIERMDRNLPMMDVKSLTEQVDQSLMPLRLIATLSSLFAVLALILACIGLYGIMNYAVARRTHEIGIRRALGAQRHHVLLLVMGQGMLLTLVGTGIGLFGAFWLTRLVARLLYGVTPTDPLTFILVTVLLITVALLASYIPARRAMRVDPMVALRYE